MLDGDATKDAIKLSKLLKKYGILTSIKLLEYK